MKSIRNVWTNPILVDESSTILAGHGRREAARRLGMREVPTITIVGLTDAEKRAIVIADNRMPEQAVWDIEILRTHFESLTPSVAAAQLFLPRNAPAALPGLSKLIPYT
jgi:ParB-like chromosome segregation protein Spo0J